MYSAAGKSITALYYVSDGGFWKILGEFSLDGSEALTASRDWHLTPGGNFNLMIGGFSESSAVGTGSIWLDDFQIETQRPAQAPQIISSPQDQTVNLGASVTFSVSASGDAPLVYQWSQNGNNLQGATGSSYTIAAAKLSDAGDYTVTVSNSAGATTSAKAHLTVTAPQPHLSLAMYAGVTVEGEVGQTYRIEYREALDAQDAWKALATITLTENSYFFLDKDSPNHPKRFYRATAPTGGPNAPASLTGKRLRVELTSGPFAGSYEITFETTSFRMVEVSSGQVVNTGQYTYSASNATGHIIMPYGDGSGVDDFTLTFTTDSGGSLTGNVAKYATAGTFLVVP
jgi:hypothetical protein